MQFKRFVPQTKLSLFDCIPRISYFLAVRLKTSKELIKYHESNTIMDQTDFTFSLYAVFRSHCTFMPFHIVQFKISLSLWSINWLTVQQFSISFKKQL